MNKKITITVFLAILLVSAITSPITGAKTTSEEDGVLIEIFESEISIEKNKDIDEPMGSSDSNKIKITVGFKLNIGPLAKQLLFGRRIGRLILFGPQYIFKYLVELPKANVTVSVEGCPDWCNATLDNSNFEFDYNNEFVNNETTLTISVNERPPALEQADIIVKVNYEGFWTIKPASNSTNIPLFSAYESKIEWDAETEHTIPPLKETTIPINITNNGNGDTIVNIAVLDSPENWNISLDQDNITIPIDNNDSMKQINLVVTPPKGFENKTINLKLTSRSTPKEDVDTKYLEGESITFSITFNNDGSLKEEEELPVIEIAVVLVIVLVLIFIVIFLLKRKKQ